MTDQRDGGITWTDETWNPIRGCSDVNDDCRNCYAKQVAATRLSGPGQAYHGLAELRNGKPYWTGQVQLVPDKLEDPLRWTRPRRVFVNSMSDLFHDNLRDDQIDQVVAVMALAPRHTFQVLTKRPKRMRAYLSDRALPERIGQLWAAGQFTAGDPSNIIWPFPDVDAVSAWPLPNVWWGASMGHQDAVDAFMPHLVACRPHAAVLWVSAEPLTERISLLPWLWKSGPSLDDFGPRPSKLIDWLVVGGESGKAARPMHPAWAKALQAECNAAGVGFHFKQWGGWIPKTYLNPDTQTTLLNISCDGKTERIVSSGAHDHADDINMVRVGKKAAGRLLDGCTWDQWPITAGQFERIG